MDFTVRFCRCARPARPSAFFIEALGFKKTGEDGAYHRFETGSGGANKTVTLLHEPDRPAGSWGFGAGTVHHIALWGADDNALAEQKAIYEELGYTDASEIKDRFYFHSMYCRCPGGILVESCCNIGGSFERDETRAELGTKLHLPPWWEHRKDEMMAQLEPITVPEIATAAAAVRGEADETHSADRAACPGLLLLSAVPSFGHHSFAAEYDSGKPITLKGKVTQFEWVNPHSWLHVDVTDDKGNT